jgi:hypothetical protein
MHYVCRIPTFSLFARQGKKACLLLQLDIVHNFLACDVFMVDTVRAEAYVDVCTEIDVIHFFIIHGNTRLWYQKIIYIDLTLSQE